MENAGRANTPAFLQLNQVFLALSYHLLHPYDTSIKNELSAMPILVMHISSWYIIKSEV